MLTFSQRSISPGVLERSFHRCPPPSFFLSSITNAISPPISPSGFADLVMFTSSSRFRIPRGGWLKFTLSKSLACEVSTTCRIRRYNRDNLRCSSTVVLMQPERERVGSRKTLYLIQDSKKRNVKRQKVITNTDSTSKLYSTTSHGSHGAYLEVGQVGEILGVHQDEVTIFPILLRHLSESATPLLEVPHQNEVFFGWRHTDVCMILADIVRIDDKVSYSNAYKQAGRKRHTKPSALIDLL